ncbi:hypothetical protein BDFG_02552 [Blastomyces dermatitidis ATCC 26199]|nr:hypothetical protein BDFG_02552 [Blastomyces dermatitidis ATCC 26199]
MGMTDITGQEDNDSEKLTWRCPMGYVDHQSASTISMVYARSFRPSDGAIAHRRAMGQPNIELGKRSAFAREDYHQVSHGGVQDRLFCVSAGKSVLWINIHYSHTASLLTSIIFFKNPMDLRPLL